MDYKEMTLVQLFDAFGGSVARRNVEEVNAILEEARRRDQEFKIIRHELDILIAGDTIYE